MFPNAFVSAVKIVGLERQHLLSVLEKDRQIEVSLTTKYLTAGDSSDGGLLRLTQFMSIGFNKTLHKGKGTKLGFVNLLNNNYVSLQTILNVKK